MTQNSKFKFRTLLTAAIFAVLISLFATTSFAAIKFVEIDRPTSSDDYPGGHLEDYPEACKGKEAGEKKEGSWSDGDLSTKFGVCPSENSKWNAPELRLWFHSAFWLPGVYGDYYISLNECVWVGAVRFCARRVASGCYLNDKGDKICPDYNYGNITGRDPKNAKVQLCAFEDSMDGMDTTGNFSPFNQGTSNDEALSIVSGLVIGGAVGLIGGPYLAVGGALTGLLTAAITQTHNHVVNRDLGCVDLPLAKGPPVWRHSAWNLNYSPKPDISLGAPSTFDKPTVVVTICEETKNGKTKLSKCRRDPSNLEQYASGISVKQTISLTPQKSNGFKDRGEYEEAGDVGSPSIGLTDLFGGGGISPLISNMVFEARISTRHPHKVCVYKIKNDSLQGCVPRPGYMPKPTIDNAESSTAELPKVNVTLGGDSVDLWEPTPNDEGRLCDTVNQVTFCARRTCIDDEPISYDNPVCKKWDDRICASGYSYAPLVVADSNNLEAISPNERPPGNEVLPRGTGFINPQVMPEIDAGGNPVDVPVVFNKDALIYNPPKCYQRDDQGACINYEGMDNGGVCCAESSELCTGIAEPYANEEGQCLQYVRNTTNGDPYIVDPENQRIRPLTSEEMGFCILKPPSKIPWIRTTPANNYQYKPPTNCAVVEVELWGAGGAGTNGSSAGDDWSGSAGGYIKARVPVDHYQTYNVVVGAGGTFKATEQKEKHSKVHDGYNGGASTFNANTLIAYGGKGKSNGPKGGGTAYDKYYRYDNKGISDLVRKTGGNGIQADCNYKRGGSAWDPAKQRYHSYGNSNGIAQCNSTQAYDSYLHKKKLSYTTINKKSNLKHLSPPGNGGCTSDVCRGAFSSKKNDLYGNVGAGGHGKAVITCVEAITDESADNGNPLPPINSIPIMGVPTITNPFLGYPFWDSPFLRR